MKYFAIQGRWISTHAPAGGATGAAAGRLCQRQNFYSRPCGRGDRQYRAQRINWIHFYSRPCGRGDREPREVRAEIHDFYSRPCGRGDRSSSPARQAQTYFYSRPCGRGDLHDPGANREIRTISTHAPAGGATLDHGVQLLCRLHFYSRPCGRGDARRPLRTRTSATFLLTPLREGRPFRFRRCPCRPLFLLTPLREGRRLPACAKTLCPYFYSRPCGRGDKPNPSGNSQYAAISTHAPAGGATLMDAEEIRCAKHFYSRPCGRGD